MPRTAEDDEHEPNSEGFAGGATAPEPGDRDGPRAGDEPPKSKEDREAEEIAIPDDLAELFGDDEEQP
jgi:hypothetical protein